METLDCSFSDSPAPVSGLCLDTKEIPFVKLYPLITSVHVTDIRIVYRYIVSKISFSEIVLFYFLNMSTK